MGGRPLGAQRQAPSGDYPGRNGTQVLGPKLRALHKVPTEGVPPQLRRLLQCPGSYFVHSIGGTITKAIPLGYADCFIKKYFLDICKDFFFENTIFKSLRNLLHFTEIVAEIPE